MKISNLKIIHFEMFLQTFIKSFENILQLISNYKNKRV